MVKKNLFSKYGILCVCIILIYVCFGSCEPDEPVGTASLFVQNDSGIRLVSLRLWSYEDETSNDDGLDIGRNLTLTMRSKDIKSYYGGTVWTLTVRTSDAKVISKEMRLIDGMTRRFRFTGTGFEYIQ